MTVDRINIFDILIANVTLARAIELIDEAVMAHSPTSIYFVNADCLNISVGDREYRKILNDAEYVFGDGIGVRIASRIAGTPIVDNVNGTDMLPFLCELCARKGYSLYLLGGKPGIAARVKEHLDVQCDGLDIRGCRDGYFDMKNQSDEVIACINDADVDVLLVAFGAPFQEKWIYTSRHQLNCSVRIGVGGLFDFYSGAKPRAPLWMRRNGIEWLHRLAYEPRRLWRRYIVGNPLFLFRVIRRAMTGKI